MEYKYSADYVQVHHVGCGKFEEWAVSFRVWCLTVLATRLMIGVSAFYYISVCLLMFDLEPFPWNPYVFKSGFKWFSFMLLQRMVNM